VLSSHRKAQPLDLAAVARFLQDRGYQVVALKQLWRHVTGLIEQADKKFFFKMASTPRISIRTRNEYTWNAMLNSSASLLPPSLRIPQNYASGFYHDDLFWFISDYFEGDLLAEKHPPRPKTLVNWLDKIVTALLGLAELDARGIWTLSDQERLRHTSGSIHIHDWLSQRAGYYLTQLEVRPRDLEAMLRLVETGPVALAPSLQHGDFVPWHMIEFNDGVFGLVDAEHAGHFFPEYYDVAYYYHRVYTTLRQPILAKLFLQKFRESLPDEQGASFLEKLRPVLAQRTMGGLWDATVDRETELYFHQALIRDLLNSTLV